MKIRTADEVLRVCPHINISAKECKEDECYEYAEDLQISCEVCGEIYNFEVLIN
jgi:hypothetical protein